MKANTKPISKEQMLNNLMEGCIIWFTSTIYDHEEASLELTIIDGVYEIFTVKQHDTQTGETWSRINMADFEEALEYISNRKYEFDTAA